VIDGIVSEPIGGAHRDPKSAIDALGTAIALALAEFEKMPSDQIRRHRQDRFLQMGRNL
jgi:acetyl-CoA carboxylase carboxyl transferase subunit alpha